MQAIQDIQALEERILAQINSKHEELFQNESLKLQGNNDLSVKIQEFVLDLLKDFPKTESGCIFIQSFYTATPHLVIKDSVLQPILEAESEGSLFGNEIGKTVTINSLAHDVFGPFTTAPLRIEIRDIVVPANCRLKQNEWTEEKVKEESGATTNINSTKTIGICDIDPSLETAEIQATVQCGDVILENHTITIKMRNKANKEIVIPLPHLAMSAKIGYDSMVTFPNGKTFSVEDTLPAGQRLKNYISLNSPWNSNLHFHIS